MTNHATRPSDYDVLLVTYDKFPHLTPDDQILERTLAAHGLRVRGVAWDDPGVDWSRARLAVLRSTWDYFLRPAEFSRWLDAVAARTTLLNPLPLVRWNFHKGYLLDLAARGIATVPTRLVRQAEAPCDLAALAAERGWHEVVVKPAVSGGARLALRCTASPLSAGSQAHFDGILEEGDALAQPYMPAVETVGERSLVFIDGVPTHGFRKAPFNAGMSGGQSNEVAYRPTDEEEAFGRRVLAALPAAPHAPAVPLYARVDMLPGDPADGQGPRLMELEMIEPALKFELHPAAAERLAAALRRELAAVR